VTIKVNTSIIALFYKSTHHIDEKVFKEISYKHLARYKQPRLFVRVDSFPVSGNGKLNRKKLKSNYESKIKYKN
jgi:acyl-CoA synthetase (AMP-forming)/AMP-acid ligase II